MICCITDLLGDFFCTTLPLISRKGILGVTQVVTEKASKNTKSPQ